MSRLDDIVTRARQAGALQRAGELRQLVEIVDARSPRVVVEIGTCHGGTLRAWCECAADNARLVSIDLPDGPFGGDGARGTDQVLNAFAREQQRLTLLREDSHDPHTQAQLLDALFGLDMIAAIDFLFIDGDHTYDGAAEDFWTYAPLVKPFGLIALHDVAPNPEDPRCQVDRLFAELTDLFDTRLIRTDGDYAGCGIGVLTRPVIWPRRPTAQRLAELRAQAEAHAEHLRAAR